ncbi:hypothetical protein B0G69_5112 [Paraburkholderia sp. RAU2J]|nr:hypothetical protein B0G69_5112 [Paraburkholderia sp. RAU2J]
MIGSGLGVAAAKTPEGAAILAAGLAIAAAGFLVTGVAVPDASKFANTIAPLQDLVNTYYNSLSPAQQSSFASSFTTNVQAVFNGGMMVPQVNASGQITGYGIDIPTAVLAQSDGSTLYTFASGVTYQQGAFAKAGPLLETANSSENIWTIPEATSGTATLGLFGDGSYGYQSTDQNGNRVAEVYIAGTGGSYSVTAGSASTFVTDSGTNNQVTAPTGSFVDLVGNADRANVSNATVIAEANTASVVSGNSNTVTASGVNVGVTLLGNNDVVNSAIANDGFAVTGTNLTFHGVGDGLSLFQNSSANVYGDGNSVAAAAAGVNATLYGNNDRIDSTFINTSWALVGTNLTFHGIGDGLSLFQNSSANVYGDSNAVAAAAAGVNATLYGNNDRIDSTFINTSWALVGTNLTFHGVGDGLSLFQNSSANVYGDGNSVAAAAAGVNATLYGNNDRIDSTFTNTSWALVGTNLTFHGVGDGLSLFQNSSANVYGDNNAVAAAAAGVTATLYGNNDRIDSTFTNTSWALVGTNLTFHGVGDGLSLFQNSSANVYGDNNAVAAAAAGVTATLYGNNDNLTSQFANNGFAVVGTGLTFHGAGDGITFFQNSGGIVYGDSNSIAASTNSAVAMNGNGNNITAGSNSVVVDNGVNNTINATNSVIVLGPENIGQTIYIYGSGNYIDATALKSSNPLVQATIVVRGTGDTIYGNNNTIIDLTGTSGNTVNGSNVSVKTNNPNYTRGSGSAPSGAYGPLNPASPAGTQINFPDYSLNDDSSSGSIGFPGDWSDPILSMPWYDTPDSSGPSLDVDILCYSGDPIVLNLNGGKVETTALSSSPASFDMRNNGQKVQTGWGTAGEGYLVYDPNDAGNTTVVNQDSQLVAGFDALQALARQVDGTGNGSLTANDALWNSLKVWVDTTGTGQFQSGELYSLDQLGITSINLNGEQVNQDNNGNQILVDSTFTWANGSTGDIAGVNLMFNPNATQDAAAPTASLSDLQISNLIAGMASYGVQPAASSTLVAASLQPQQATLAANLH